MVLEAGTKWQGKPVGFGLLGSAGDPPAAMNMPKPMTGAGISASGSRPSQLARLVVSGTTTLAPAIRAGDVLMLAWVGEWQIPTDHRAFVRLHVDRAARRLGLGPIKVLWFGPGRGRPGDFRFLATADGELPAGLTPPPAVYGPMTIGLNASLRGHGLVAAVVAHEVRHVWQARLAAALQDEAQCERDAEQFAAAYVASEGR